MTSRTNIRPTYARLLELRPTQMAVGYEEVEAKRSRWRALTSEGQALFLSSHRFPALAGPDGFFLIDGHHMGLALLHEGVDVVPLSVVDDLSGMTEGAFLNALKLNGYVCPCAAQIQSLRDLPQSLRDLADDPFRSVVARLRRNCGCPKDHTPFAEIGWADFLRAQMRLESFYGNPETAYEAARKLIRDTLCRDVGKLCPCMDEGA